MVTRYRIIGITNSWIAQRDANFKGRTKVVFKDDLSLKEAQKELLRMYNHDNDTCYSNWGLAVIHSAKRIDGAFTYSNGMRCYRYDSRDYMIEEYETN